MTDFFEKRAENAAKYAIHLAQQLHANIILYNSFLVPAAEPLGGQVYWSMEDYNVLQQDSEKQLDLLADRLREELSTSSVNTFRPAISCKSQEGPLYMYINKIAANRDVMLLVMGTHRKGLASLIMGNHMRDIIGSVSLPVLIIPENQSFRKLDKLIFATDMNDSDLDIIQSLTALCKTFSCRHYVSLYRKPGNTGE
ncbi:universal stress protein [Pedobacter sp. NJ-S-72]